MSPESTQRGKPFGVAVDTREGLKMWQCESLEAAYLVAGVNSFDGLAVVVEFIQDEAITLAIYNDGKPDCDAS